VKTKPNMGCAESRAKYEAAELANDLTPVGTTIAGLKPAQEAKTLYLKEKVFTLGGEFKVRSGPDSDSPVEFIIKGKVLTMRDKMVVTDAKGKKLCVMQQKILQIRPNYVIYTYSPNFKGQESVDTEDGAPLYRCAKFEQVVCACPNKGNFGFFQSSNDEFVPALKVQEALACKLLVLISDMDDNVVGKVGQTALFQWNDKFACHIAKGQDALATLCIAIASEQIREQQNNSGGG